MLSTAQYAALYQSPTGLIDYLAVGGAGPGGWMGGGGAGGEVVEQRGVQISPGIYAVSPGVGGSPAATEAGVGATGTASTLIGPGLSVTARPGAAGGSVSRDGRPLSLDSTIANGGGCGTYTSTLGGIGAVYNGGDGPSHGAGGGAGAAGAGSPDNGLNDLSGAASGAGGAPVTSDITGTALDYGAGGGGGGNDDGAAQITAGAAGGPSAGPGRKNSTGVARNLKRGGGGGGGGGSTGLVHHIGGKGDDGCVIIRYVTGSMIATGGTITTSGIYTIHTFTAAGNFIVS